MFKDIFKNVICLLLIHIIANVGICAMYLLAITLYSSIVGALSEEFSTFLFQIVPLLLLGRLLVLPIAYKKLENSKNFELVANFIKRLRQYPHLKIIVLIVAYFSSWPTGFPYDFDAYSQLLQGVFFGLFGNYLVLFAYWFIEDLIKKILSRKCKQ